MSTPKLRQYQILPIVGHSGSKIAWAGSPKALEGLRACGRPGFPVYEWTGEDRKGNPLAVTWAPGASGWIEVYEQS